MRVLSQLYHLSNLLKKFLIFNEKNNKLMVPSIYICKLHFVHMRKINENYISRVLHIMFALFIVMRGCGIQAGASKKSLLFQWLKN
jgi:hypothetical protein